MSSWFTISHAMVNLYQATLHLYLRIEDEDIVAHSCKSKATGRYIKVRNLSNLIIR